MPHGFAILAPTTTKFDTMPKPGKKGLPRIIDAAGYSWQGLKYAYTNEAAFREECWLLPFIIVAAFWLGDSAEQVVLLLIPTFLVLITELLNSGIEAVVDRISDEVHPLSGAAKDMGSAAVFMAMMLFLVIWVGVIFFG
ncbi:MAG: diacylglycerol kinase (ATP) [Parvicella sp.]|jgi:diacylglycerol kinase (ATP)